MHARAQRTAATLAGLLLALGLLLGVAPSAFAERPARGSLVIEGATSGAEVFVDGELVGVAPLEPVDLPLGNHALRVTRPGYTEFTDVVRIRKGKPTVVHVELMAVSMILTVESVPTAAQVFVDEKFSGETPVDLDLVEGRHVLRLKKSLYRELERDVDAVAGETVTWKLELEAIPEAERLAMEPLPPDAWYQQPTTWILIGGAAAVVAAGVVLAVVLSSDSPSAASGFCAKVDDCVRVP